VASTPAFVLQPATFFVARSGVVTLAYHWFPQGVLELKRAISHRLPLLPPEQPGSRWPKTTLAALRADEPLEVDEIERLRALTSDGDRCLARSGVSIRVTSLELVHIRNRALEGEGPRRRLPLSPEMDSAGPDPEHAARVSRILDQWGHWPDGGYTDDIRRDGHRERHYRMPCNELTLVAPIVELPECVRTLRQAVESTMPGRYAWFESRSRHVTIRTFGPPDPEDE
jgi:hypothetical protein